MGRSGGGRPVARSFPHPVSFHSPSGGKPRLPWQFQGVAHGSDQACVRACVAACRLACRPACGYPEPRADLRAALREPRADLRAALRGQILRPPPPSAPFGLALSRMGISEERNETRGEYWSVDLKFSHCTSDRLESETTARDEPRP